MSILHSLEVGCGTAGTQRWGLSRYCDGNFQKPIGTDIEFKIYDNSDYLNRKQYFGWHNLELLRKEGNRERIKQRLSDYLELRKAEGAISLECFRQACGGIPE
jgi:hypothetical protein